MYVILAAYWLGYLHGDLGLFGETHANTINTMINEMTLWKIVEVLVEQIPFSKQRVEALLHTRLRGTGNTGNDVFQFYESSSIELKEGVVISNVDLRIKRTGGPPGFMVLEICGQCITLDQIRQHYDDLRMTDSPKENSQYEKMHYTAMLPWGLLSFGFFERSPECLASIALKPNK